MKKKKESPALNDKLEATIDTEIESRLRDLLALGIDPELFGEFERKVLLILTNRPESKEIVISELDKTEILLWQMVERTKSRKRGVLIRAANDDIFPEEKHWEQDSV